MRRVEWLVGLGALLAGVAGISAVGGCTADFGSCDKFPHVGCPGYSTSSSSGSASSSSGMMPTCVGDPLADGKLISDTCGVFVSATAPAGGKGTKESPFNLLSDAIGPATSGSKYLFVCGEKYVATDTVTINGAVQLYGNLTGCASGAMTWTMGDATMAANRATLTGPADKIAMVLGATSGKVEIYGLDVAAPNAAKMADGMGSNGSSIAVYVNGGSADFINSDLTAGDAMAGAQGVDAPMGAATAGVNGSPGGAACSAVTVNGAPQTTNACGGAMSVGGNGGNGAQGNGTPGSQGLPASTGGQAGVGDDGSAGWTCQGKMGNGGDGAQGTDGPAGMASTGFGALTATGFAGAVGGDGMPGTPGQGGGGGGGVRGSAAFCPGTNTGGASGGSGGSGGCGGAAGKGGIGGGSSIALVTENATVTLAGVKLTAGAGGAGGRGGNPQAGGAKSTGGSGGALMGTLSPGCDGGKGGKGGSGGPGSGGRGGHSLAIASSGSAPTLDSKSVAAFATTAATGGPGGNNNASTNPGAAGLTGKCYDFMKGTPCP